MRIIGVLDLAHGRAVHARAGRREEYLDVRQAAAAGIAAGDPRALATAYRERLGIDELYAADLDAIASEPPQPALTRQLAAIAPLWLDAGIRSADAAAAAITNGASRVVVGLETLPSFAALTEICDAVGSDRVAFSLDLRDGRALHRMTSLPDDIDPTAIAARAADAGASATIVLDLARVGTGSGLDLQLIADIRTAIGDRTLIAGGGVRGLEDLTRLADRGCDGALVATALHNGRLTAADVVAARRLQASVSR